MVSIAQHFHDRTKYAPETIHGQSQGLDWSTQPEPYKTYKLGHAYDLKHFLYEKASTSAEGLLLTRWQKLSKLLFCSYGLTAKIRTLGGEPLFLRSAPSAGGLYPGELYLVSRGSAMLPGGLYNYQVRDHALLQYWTDSQVWDRLRGICFGHPWLGQTNLAMVISGVFFRSAWRYNDRAYRRIGLDIGHLLGNIMLAANLNDFQAHVIGGFADPDLNELLYLDPEQEGVFCVVPLLDRSEVENLSPEGGWTALGSTVTKEYPQLPEGQLLSFLHQASMISLQTKVLPQSLPAGQDKYNFPFCTRIAMETAPIDWGTELAGLEGTLLKRRSTRSFTSGEIDLSELKSVLHFAYQPQDYQDQGLTMPSYFDLGLIETFMAVLGVAGIEAGCYYYAPGAQELRQIRFKHFRHELHYLCLGQNLGRDAAVVIFHTTDLTAAVERYGDRAYRYLHMDAGHLGQRMNLAAIHLGLGVSGIGGFFDDQVNEVLGIPATEVVLYLTALGQPA